MRYAEQGGGQRVGDLVLDDLRRLPGILGVDDHLHVREVGDRIERRSRHRPNARKNDEHRADQHQHDIVRGPADQAGDHRCWCSPAVNRLSAASKVALGVDQEVGAGDHPLALANAIEDLDETAGARSEADRARLETPLASFDQHHLPPAVVDHRGLRHGDDAAPAGWRGDGDARYHLLLQEPAGIGDLDAHAGRPGFTTDGRVDEGDPAAEGAAWKGPDLDRGRLAHGDARQVLLEDLGDQPHLRQIDYGVERLARHEPHALHRLLLDHGPAVG